MQPFTTSRSALAALVTAALFAAATAAQAPQGLARAEASPEPAPLRSFPAPANLQALPKGLSGEQVHQVMEEWADSLGVRCSACHSEETETAGLDGRPRLNFADDSKPMKAAARLMYRMTGEINGGYIAKIEGSGMPVTCGTCHRGQVSPEPFTIVPVGEQELQTK